MTARSSELTEQREMAAAQLEPPESGAQATASGARSRCLVLLVPGMAVTEPGLYLGKLVEGLKGFTDTRQVDLSEVGGQRAGDRRRFLVSEGETLVEIELLESYWSDLRPRLSAASGFNKLLGALSLLAFCLLSPRVWAQSLGGIYMFLNASVTLLVLLAWYYGALATLLTASGAEPALLRPFGLEGLGPAFASWGKSMGGWRVWLAVGVVSALLPTLLVVDVAHAAMAYLKNRDHFASKVKARLSKLLYGAFKEDFDRIVIVAHSFGVGIAVEALAELDVKPKMPLSLMTLGGSLGLLRARSPRVEAAYREVLKLDTLSSWTDFWSDQDWLGTPALEAHHHMPNARLTSHAIDASVSLLRKLSGESHALYFSEPQLYETLLEQSGPAPAGAVALTAR